MVRARNGPPEIARTNPDAYESLLRAKVRNLQRLLARATDGELPRIETFESERQHFRVRADFTAWCEADDVRFVMFNRGDKRTPHEVPHYPLGSRRINELMPRVLCALEAELALRDRIHDVRFLTTLSGDAAVTLTYNRRLGADGEWKEAAARLVDSLGAGPMGQPVKVIGRSQGVKLVINGDTVEERLAVGGGRGECIYTQAEGEFSQPNAQVCEHMLSWAYDATRGLEHSDLVELFCGNGCFTVCLAPNFRRVVAAELSAASVALARRNLAANGLSNVSVVQLSAESFARGLTSPGSGGGISEAVGVSGPHGGGRVRSPLEQAAPVDAQTLFVDPPRPGLDAICRAFASRFERVLYMSCNPATLARDVTELRKTHRVARLAAFDQFPYTHHLVCSPGLPIASPLHVCWACWSILGAFRWRRASTAVALTRLSPSSVSQEAGVLLERRLPTAVHIPRTARAGLGLRP